MANVYMTLNYSIQWSDGNGKSLSVFGAQRLVLKPIGFKIDA